MTASPFRITTKFVKDLGGWMHIRRLAREYRVMGDVVINHVSAQSNWFRDFKKGIAPARDYFHVTEPSPALDQVTRPRNLPLLTPVKTPMGPVHVWTTFSPDQIDLNFANPDVLFEFLDIILLYISQGVSVLRQRGAPFSVLPPSGNTRLKRGTN